jgi:hypothetical protein
MLLFAPLFFPGPTPCIDIYFSTNMPSPSAKGTINESYHHSIHSAQVF